MVRRGSKRKTRRSEKKVTVRGTGEGGGMKGGW
jgi:hypothetical protein